MIAHICASGLTFDLNFSGMRIWDSLPGSTQAKLDSGTSVLSDGNGGPGPRHWERIARGLPASATQTPWKPKMYWQARLGVQLGWQDVDPHALQGVSRDAHNRTPCTTGCNVPTYHQHPYLHLSYLHRNSNGCESMQQQGTVFTSEGLIK